MKLAFLNDDIYKYASGAPSAVGGAERQQWLLARALARTGWSVTVGVCDELEPYRRMKIDGVEFTGIGRVRGHILLNWYRFFLSEQPTWWYWRCASHLLGPAVAITKALRVRTIFAAALDPDVTPRRALFQRSNWWPLYALGLSWSDRIFVQHGGQLARLAPKLRLKSYIVPSIAGETTGERPAAHRAKYVAWIGQLKHPKRPDVLVEIAQRSPGIRFVVCGGPSTFMSPLDYSERMIARLCALSNVEYRGQVAPCDALRVIAEAALLLSTADEEGFPNTFLHAWSSGTPVVSLKVDPDSIIERNGLGVISNSVPSAIKVIESLMDSPEQRDVIATRALRYVKDRHSEAVVLAVFNRAVQGVRS